jgi:hypothetical protein
MKAPQVLALDEAGLNYVETQLKLHLANTEFSYAISINKNSFPLFRAAKSLEAFEQVKKMYLETEDIFSIDVTFRTGKSKGGFRIVLADSDNEADYNALELSGYPKYSTTGQQQREQEIIDRERVRWEKDSLQRENESLKETVTGLKDQLKKADEFSNEVEKLITDLKSKTQDKGTLEQVGDFLGKVAAYAPGLLKNTPLDGMIKPAETVAPVTLGETTATPKTEAQPIQQNAAPQYDEETIALCETLRTLKPFFSVYEFQDCFKLLGLLARHKPLIPELYDLALGEIKRLTAIRQAKVERTQPQPKHQQEQEKKQGNNPEPQQDQGQETEENPQTEEEEKDETEPPNT